VRGSSAAWKGDLCPDLSRALALLSGLPLRPATVWTVLRQSGDTDLPAFGMPEVESGLSRADPGWLEAHARGGVRDSDLQLVAQRPWWRARTERGIRALERLARWSAAVAWTLRARLAPGPDAALTDAVSRVSWLAPLGLWAIAAVDPHQLASWLDCPDRTARRRWEEEHLGETLGWLGRRLADQWELPALVRWAAWAFFEPAHAPGRPNDTESRVLIDHWTAAREWVEGTPLALVESRATGPRADPEEVRAWLAGFQAASPTPFMAFEPGDREGLVLRAYAQTLARSSVAPRADAPTLSVAAAVLQTHPASSWQSAAREVERALTALPGVALARIQKAEEWPPPGDISPAEPGREPDLVLPLPDATDPRFTLTIWWAEPESNPRPLPAEAIDLVRGWSRYYGEIEGLRQLAQAAIDASHTSGPEPGMNSPALTQALAQFAAGAGHELNNPLAVIMGRAQLLLARLDDTEVQRSLRVIIAQSQRAHRMLRDLMYYAQPSAARPRPCLPEEVVRRGLDDLRAEADSRGVLLQLEVPAGPRTPASLDPDQLRLSIDALVRNALEASPPATTVQVRVQRRGRSLRLEVLDQGRGLRADEGHRLLNPLYSGRQAGRGLGLGLPRLARMLDEIGGTLHWSARPSGGMRFQVRWPLSVDGGDVPRT
jgi:signal transduction histidine kinase